MQAALPAHGLPPDGSMPHLEITPASSTTCLIQYIYFLPLPVSKEVRLSDGIRDVEASIPRKTSIEEQADLPGED